MQRTTAVGIFPDGASVEGALDMAGNVWEWCGDWYDEKAYEKRKGQTVTDPMGPAAGEFRILRGGSWFAEENTVRCAYRNGLYPDGWNDYSGFRLARSLR